MKMAKRICAIILILATFCSLAVPVNAAAPNGSDLATVASNEEAGTTGQKYRDWFYGTGKNTWAAWCAIFVSWCANQAGVPTNVIPKDAVCGSMKSSIIKFGGKTVSTPQAGDLVFYYDNNDGAKRYAHVGIMINSTESVQGNLGGKVQYVSKVTKYNLGYKDDEMKKNYTVVYVRPPYGGGQPVSCSVTTGETTDISKTAATVHGYVSANIVPSEIGMYWGTSKTDLKKLGSDTTNGKNPHMWYSTSKYYGALKSNTTYYYQGYAVVGGKTFTGSVKSFTTLPDAQPPTPTPTPAPTPVTPSACTVTTGEAKDISSTGATLHGYISASAVPSEIGMYWGTSKDNLKKLGCDKTTSKSPHMWYSTSKYYGNLKSGTTYYYRGYAIVNGTKYWGDVKCFTTSKNTSLRTGKISGTSNALRIRKGPGTSYSVVSTIPEGQTCSVNTSKSSGNWYYVTYNGVSGYSSKNYIKLQ